MRTKTITIDFDLYEGELLEERKRGFEIVHDLKSRLDRAVTAMNGYSKDDYDTAKRLLFQILKDLDSRPLARVANDLGDAK